MPATNAAYAPAPRAQFDPTVKRRRSLEGMIHVAIKQLNMVDDDYRQLLFDATKTWSLKDCSEKQLGLVVDALKAKGFRPTHGGAKGMAQTPMAKKARALWISLYQLGAVHNPSEQALDAYAKRQLGCDKLIWANQRDAFKLIEALKSWGQREGWRMTCPNRLKPYGPIELQGSLCNAILGKLKAVGLVPADWGLHDAAYKLCGVDRDTAWTASDYQALAAGLGAELRRVGHGAGGAK